MSERKYRHRGYQDHDDDRSSRHGDPPRRHAPNLGPRGRGLGRPTASTFRCAVCGRAHEAPVEEGTCCSACGAALHTCTHCAHFDTSARHECRKPVVAPIAGKAKANDCSLFDPRVTRELATEATAPADAKAAFDALFKL